MDYTKLRLLHVSNNETSLSDNSTGITDVTMFLLTRQNLSKSSMPNCLFDVAASNDCPYGVALQLIHLVSANLLSFRHTVRIIAPFVLAEAT